MLIPIKQQLLRLGSQIVPEMVSGRFGSGAQRVKLSIGAKTCIVETIGLLRMLQAMPDLAGNHLIVSGIHNCAVHGEAWAS